MICFPADIGDLSLHEEMLDAAQNQWGRLDCLLNNAGISVKSAVIFWICSRTVLMKILPSTPARPSSSRSRSANACWRSLNRNTNYRIARLFCQLY
nr:3-ketoacyl-(acyl-carrier-protein) reductase [Klebsiella pneumoniae]